MNAEEKLTRTLALSIKEMEFSVRTENSLLRVGLLTIGEVAGRTERQLLEVFGLGPKQLLEIKRKLEEQGLSLTQDNSVSEKRAKFYQSRIADNRALLKRVQGTLKRWERMATKFGIPFDPAK